VGPNVTSRIGRLGDRRRGGGDFVARRRVPGGVQVARRVARERAGARYPSLQAAEI